MASSVTMKRHLHVCLSLLVLLSLPLSSHCQEDLETKALLQFKKTLADPLNHLQTWTNATSPCRFLGVRCHTDTGTVTAISLSGKNLSGAISPAVSALRGLARLELDSNSISGAVPYELGNCTELMFLNLSFNGLTGELPDLSSLASLQVLDVANNGFSGRFPSWVGTLSSLVTLSLGVNSFEEGETPASIGNLKKLTYLYLARCNLRGEIPTSIYELTSLETLDFSMNQISGEFPRRIAELLNLSKIELYQNNLTGELPPELAKLTGLREFDVSRNQMTGAIPPELGGLKNFRVIQLFRNNFSGPIPAEWGELRFLTSFSIYENVFSGEFPPNFGRFSPLNSVDISENGFSGLFPRYICHSQNLQFLLALENGFSGEFPGEYSSCKSLVRFRVNHNRFSGRLPEGLWGLPEATIIDISDNEFTGSISPLIGMSRSLSQLIVQNNRLGGSIPAEIGKLAHLQKLYLSDNSFSGSIPLEIGNLYQLTSLHLEYNALTGPLPEQLGTCRRLVEIDVSRNTLAGPIPAALSLLLSLNSLNLSWNEITGPIPSSLQMLKLSSIDFSSNRLTGSVPPGLLLIAGDEAFAGNPGLCIDGKSELGVCNVDDGHKDGMARRSLVLVPVLVSALLFLMVGVLCVSYRSFKLEELKKMDMEQGTGSHQWKLESFHPPEVDAEEIFGVGEENLIGSGGTGRVYRLELKSRGTVAVKRLWKGNAAKVMTAEMAILGRIRHRNILKLHASLSGGEVNFVVYEYMPRGNLHQALQREGKSGRTELDWRRRHKVALGAAKGVMYLHHDCSPAIIHRDIKSTNILLDEDYEAKIADFGIAKVAEDSDSSCFAGTHGYLAPELAYSVKVSEKTDVYSFGVVLLELVTGRSPIDPHFGEGKDIVFWLSSKLNSDGGLDDVLDPRVPGSSREDMLKVLKIAVLCTAMSPAGRPTMRHVVKMLVDADPCSRSRSKSCC